MQTHRFTTRLGCTMAVWDAPEHLGPGVMMSGAMDQPGDGRRFEVYLDPESHLALSAALDARWDAAGDPIATRLRRAVARLEERRDTLRVGSSERTRLDGKIEGVKLAASYLNEDERIFPAADTGQPPR